MAETPDPRTVNETAERLIGGSQELPLETCVFAALREAGPLGPEGLRHLMKISLETSCCDRHWLSQVSGILVYAIVERFGPPLGQDERTGLYLRASQLVGDLTRAEGFTPRQVMAIGAAITFAGFYSAQVEPHQERGPEGNP